MKIQVKYNDLEDLGTKLDEKKKNIDEILDNIQKLIEDSTEAWQGQDSEAFTLKANEMIMKEKERNKKLEILSSIIVYAAKHYKSEDEEWLELMKKEEINS